MRPTVIDATPTGRKVNRRSVLFGLAAAVACIAVPVNATPPAAVFGCGWHRKDRKFVLISASLGQAPVALTALPGRGHDIVAHPSRALLCVIARRPGTWALIVDPNSGDILHRISSPPGRHLYGHAAFDPDGTLHLAENDFQNDQGLIAHYEAGSFHRIGETQSGGIGPHEILPGRKSGTLVVANGGILTRPETGRAKLNLSAMQSNLSVVDWKQGRIKPLYHPPAGLDQLSIRHIAQSGDGSIALGMQYQGDKRLPVPLVVRVTPGSVPQLLPLAPGQIRDAQAYIGSIAVSQDGQIIAASAPRAGQVYFWDRASGRRLNNIAAKDVCGLAPGDGGGDILMSTGGGDLHHVAPRENAVLATISNPDLQWDNHLIRI